MPQISNTTNKTIKGKYDIHERIYNFILRVITLVNALPKNQSNQIITAQILRCVTSMGANDQEADGTLTKKDFLHCYTIVRKENKETIFWLSLISDTNLSFKPRMKDVLQEGREIVAIISSIINNTRSH
ncbi:MAG: four helix bundle protein [Candidatus Levybacteria bacterium]|nr:four helix bundle protein [Candidatus Levybacteria bacterium]